MASVLNDIKKLLGIPDDDTSFDTDIMIHINSHFLTLNGLGVGPETPFMISSSEDSWDGFTQGKLNLESVKLYIYLKTRLAFDPPSTSFVGEALKKQADEIEWRLNVEHDKVVQNG